MITDWLPLPQETILREHFTGPLAELRQLLETPASDLPLTANIYPQLVWDQPGLLVEGDTRVTVPGRAGRLLLCRKSGAAGDLLLSTTRSEHTVTLRLLPGVEQQVLFNPAVPETKLEGLVWLSGSVLILSASPSFLLSLRWS